MLSNRNEAQRATEETKMAEVSELPFHEKQSILNQLCLVHALNMLLGDHILSKENLDQICETLTDKVWWNPHRSPFGLGNYDVNVAMYALQQFGLIASFVDSRFSLDAKTLELSETNLLVNVGGSRFIPGSRHWFVYRFYSGSWYRLDSCLSGPVVVDDMAAALQQHSKQKDHILTIQPEA